MNLTCRVIFHQMAQWKTESTSAGSGGGESVSDILIDLKLPDGYGEFLTETNGGILFGSNVLLYGLRDSYDIPPEYRVRFGSPEIAVPNVHARRPFLDQGDSQIGTYSCQQRVLYFSRALNQLCLTEAFSARIAKRWSNFFEYYEQELLHIPVSSMRPERSIRAKEVCFIDVLGVPERLLHVMAVVRRSTEDREAVHA